MKLVLRLLGLLRPFSGWVALSILLSAATIASSIGLLGTSAYLIASAALHPSVAALQVAIVGVRFFGIARAIFRYLERLVTHEVNFRLLASLRRWFYHTIEPLAPAGLQGFHRADLMNRMSADIDQLENFYVRVVVPPLVALMITVVAGLWTGRYSPWLGGVLCAGLTANALLAPWLVGLAGRWWGGQVVVLRSKLRVATIDGLQGLSDLLLSGQSARWLERLAGLNRELAGKEAAMGWAGGAVNAINLLVSNLTLLAVLWWAIPLVRLGVVDGIFLAVISLVTLACFESVAPFGLAAQHFHSSLAAAERLFALETGSQPAATGPVSRSAVTAPGPASLSVRGLSFRYAAGLPLVVEDLSFELPAGKRLAVVGPSGSGKSTLLSLLMRFWDYDRGEIRIEGQELKDLPLEQARRYFSWVAQSTYIFDTTLRQNLLLARPGATPVELEEVLIKVRLGDWLAALPDGMETWLGEHGVQMSAGERQRLAIARAVLYDAPVLLLDEPTAHLDVQTEMDLIDNILEVSAGRSLVWVTHRFTALEKMDEILVMRSGRLLEHGRHAQLLAQKGAYARLWELQNNLIDTPPGTTNPALTS
ncbi:MAG: thiol reductant ABC exporter subunit CydC [Chloroflexi bacterium]|nr:thiol reductant ABC exporter subunit CydC [Chloroflexota bacterium]